MAGRHSWAKLREELSPEQLERAKQRTDAIELGVLIGELRRQMGVTQIELAERMGLSQPRLSQLETAGEMQVATLNRIVAELGGEIVLHLPTGDVSLTKAVYSGNSASEQNFAQ